MPNKCTCGHARESHRARRDGGVVCVEWVGLGRCLCPKFTDLEEHNARQYEVRPGATLDLVDTEEKLP